MIFKYPHYLDILDGKKTQTRRPMKPGETGENSHGFTTVGTDGRHILTHWNTQIDTVRTLSGYPKYRTGHSYAVQAERTGKGIYRIWLETIRHEKLQDIRPEDVKAEGYESIEDFKAAWDEIYKHSSMKKYRWDQNPEVWVLGISPL